MDQLSKDLSEARKTVHTLTLNLKTLAAEVEHWQTLYSKSVKELEDAYAELQEVSAAVKANDDEIKSLELRIADARDETTYTKNMLESFEGLFDNIEKHIPLVKAASNPAVDLLAQIRSIFEQM